LTTSAQWSTLEVQTQRLAAAAAAAWWSRLPPSAATAAVELDLIRDWPEVKHTHVGTSRIAAMFVITRRRQKAI